MRLPISSHEGFLQYLSILFMDAPPMNTLCLGICSLWLCAYYKTQPHDTRTVAAPVRERQYRNRTQ